MAETGRELDLEIVSTSWRSLSEADAFDRMMEAWDRKLAAIDREPRLPLLDGILKRQLASIDRLLDDRRTILVEDPVELALSETPAPAMVLSPDGLVIAHNDGASDHFGVQQGLSAGTGWMRDDSLPDYRAVRESGPGRGNVDYAIVRTVVDEEREALAEVYRLEIEGTAKPYTVVRSLELEWYPNVSAALTKVFGLTRAETEICQLLFVHRDLDAVARERSVALETVRTQVKTILGKTELHSKAELVRLLALLCARAAFQHEQVDLAWSDPFGHERIFVRRDGRKLAHSWIGADDGRPVLFLPGQTSFNFLPESIRRRLEREGIKLVSPSLPGHGNSDPALGKEQLVDGCDALEEWCEAMEFGPIPALATRGGQFYLIRLATLRPDLLSMLMCVSLPWNIPPSRANNLPLVQRTLFKLALDAPLAFELACRLGHRMLRQKGPDFYWTRGYSDTAADLASIKDPEIQPLLRASVRHTICQGHTAFMREQELCVKSPLPQWVQNLQLPLHWLIPGQTVDLDDEDMAHILGLNPLVSAELVPGTGELLPFQAPELFADRLVALAASELG